MEKNNRCNCALDNGQRCPNMTYHNWARCEEHRRYSLGISLTKNHKKILWKLKHGGWHYCSTPVTGKRYNNAIENLIGKGLVERNGEGEAQITDWGRSITGHAYTDWV